MFHDNYNIVENMQIIFFSNIKSLDYQKKLIVWIYILIRILQQIQYD